jgi:hypothetical protein
MPSAGLRLFPDLRELRVERMVRILSKVQRREEFTNQRRLDLPRSWMLQPTDERILIPDFLVRWRGCDCHPC